MLDKKQIWVIFKIWVQNGSATAAKSFLLCPTLCDPVDCSLPGSSVHGILQARTLEWVAISFSNAWKWKVKVKSLSRVWLLATPWTTAYQAPPSMGFSGQQWGAIAFSLKMGHKAANTAQNNNTFGPGTANEHTVQKWFKNFCTGLRIFASGLRNFAQEFLHRWGAQWLAIRNWPWTIESNHRSWSSYNYTRICRRTQCWPSYSRLAFEANGKVKKFKWCFMNWSKLKNIVILEWRLLILCNNKESFLDWIVMCNKNNFIQQLTTAYQWLDW